MDIKPHQLAAAVAVDVVPNRPANRGATAATDVVPNRGAMQPRMWCRTGQQTGVLCSHGWLTRIRLRMAMQTLNTQ